MNIFRWFRESKCLICSQAKHITTISIFFTSLTQTQDFDPLFKVLLVIFQLGTGRHSIRLEKMIPDCKFQILGIKTIVGHYIIIFSRNSIQVLHGSEFGSRRIVFAWECGGEQTSLCSVPRLAYHHSLESSIFYIVEAITQMFNNTAYK